MRTFKTLFTTFYSYKGGVGRTSALVNTALLRAVSGDRVIVIDFDMEAPGVFSYVKTLADKQKKSIEFDNRPGILEYIYGSLETDKIPNLLPRAVTSKDLGLDIEGEIWFIGAGNTADNNYTKKLTSLNWSEIFEKKQGALFLENFKRQIAHEFNSPDYVFIDSRTGITEIGGVCTKYLADLVVVLSSLNEQNIIGTSRIVESFKESDIATILVASNVPVGLPWGPEQLFSERIENFSTNFKSKPDLLIYHYPSLSLMEYLPAYFKIQKEKSFLKEDPLLKSYETLSDKINQENESNFEKFFVEDVINRLFVFDQKRRNDLDDALKFFAKHYGHRKELYNLVNKLLKLRGFTDGKSKKGVIPDDIIVTMHEVKANLNQYKVPQLQFLKRFVLDNISEQLVTHIKANKNSVGSFIAWFDVLSEGAKMDFIEVLLECGEYKTVYDKIDDKFAVDFGALAKGFAAEKLSYTEEAKTYYQNFFDKMEEDSGEFAGLFFAFGFSAFKIGKVEVAQEALNRARELVDTQGDSTFLFVPTLFKRAESKGEFLKELSKFEKLLEVKN